MTRAYHVCQGVQTWTQTQPVAVRSVHLEPLLAQREAYGVIHAQRASTQTQQAAIANRLMAARPERLSMTSLALARTAPLATSLFQTAPRSATSVHRRPPII